MMQSLTVEEFRKVAEERGEPKFSELLACLVCYMQQLSASRFICDNTCRISCAVD